MAFTPISNTAPQYEENGIAASGFYIKFYESGTTTPTAMATDSTGATLLDKCQLNSEGYPINGSGAVFIPHINVEYKIALFRNAADADANNLANAAWDVDGLFPVPTGSSIGTDFDQVPLNTNIVYPVATVADLRLLTGISVGQKFQLDGHTNQGIGGGSLTATKLHTTEIDNNGTLFVVDGVVIERELNGYVSFEMFGILSGGTDWTSEMSDLRDAMIQLGEKVLRVGVGTYIGKLVGFHGLQIIGSGWSGYSPVPDETVSVLKRGASQDSALDFYGFDGIHLQDLDIDGSSGGTGEYAAWDSQGFAFDCSAMRVKFHDGDVGLLGNAALPIGEFHALHCVFRNNRKGMANFRDSNFSGVTLSGNREGGWYNNQGQVRFTDGFIEFSRGSGGALANGIDLGPNANETTITGCQFDRNSGNDINIAAGAHMITISNNMLKGSAYSPDLSKNNRYSISASTASSISLIGNQVQTRNYQPSPEEGFRSPLGFCNLSTATGVVESVNNLAELTNPLDISGYKFVASASGTDEYYMLFSDVYDNPWIDQPDDVSNGLDTLSIGTIGALASDEYAWGDNDSLGFDTLYLRLSSGASPDTESPRVHYDIKPKIFSGNDVQTDSYRDGTSLSISALSSEVFVLKTRELITSTFSRKAFTLSVSGDESATSLDSFAEFPFLISRGGSGIAVSIKEGAVLERETGYTQGWSSAGPFTLEVSIEAAPGGDEVQVTLSNTGANRLDLEAWLNW